jgi:APA family basic amino acid/polyamine antiporter
MANTKHFGFWTLLFLVVANMVGAGVFTTSGFTLRDLGSPHLVVAAWAIAGLIAVCGAVGYGQLARWLPESGGEYLFLSRAAHPLLGFVAGWVSLIAGFSGAIAYAARALESYLAPVADRPDWLPSGGVAVLAIVAAGLFHGWRPRLGAALQNGVVALKLLLLAAFLSYAATQATSHTWHAQPLVEAPSSAWQTAAALAGSLVWISLSYSGFNAAVYIAGEADDARRIVPSAMMCATLLVAVLYVLLNAVFVYAAPAEAIAGQDDVAAVAARWLGGAGFAHFVRVCICAALLTSVLSMMLAAPRVYAKMADDGWLPGVLRITGQAPTAAVVTQVTIAAALVLLYETLEGLLAYLSLTLSLSAACSVACLFLPSVRRLPLWHPALWLPAFYVVSTVFVGLALIANDWLPAVGTVVTFAAGAALYFACSRVKRKGD